MKYIFQELSFPAG